MEKNYKLIIGYDGTRYFGWEHQPGKDTIQGKLEDVLNHLAEEPVLIIGAGRTDAGVHARAMVANVVLSVDMTAEELRDYMKGSGIGTSATRAEILKKLVNNKYLSLNKKTQIITPTLQGELIYDTVSASIKSLLNPELTASWEKGLNYVAEGTITPEEYMTKLTHFIQSRTSGVLGLRNQYIIKDSFERVAPFYKKSR